jgi:hypothetical protein
MFCYYWCLECWDGSVVMVRGLGVQYVFFPRVRLLSWDIAVEEAD